ncbi:MAG: hypothetical protein IJY84_04310 [Clostridia bacterium]|nr:hypothetical protein [Clostridia bacterium]
MLVEKIREYTKRKELSNKAKSELAEILKDVNFEDKSEIQGIISELLNLHADVLYSFILTLDIEKANILAEEIDCKNANKALHIYLSVLSLHRIGNDVKAKSILEQFISVNAFGKKINKQVYIGLDKALGYEGASVLLSECESWNQRNINGFRKIWIEAAEYLKNDKFSKYVLQWFENNKITPTQKEFSSFIKTDKVVEEPKVVVEQSKPLNELTIEDLLKEFAKRVKDADKIKEERNELSSLNVSLKSEILKLKQDIVQQQADNKKILLDKEEIDRENLELRKQIIELKNLLTESQGETQKLKMKLENVESAYGQAGQTEVDSIVGKIKSRLSSEHEKYLEIKAKEPDMDYYDVLIAMLDEIYRVLKKNGITF